MFDSELLLSVLDRGLEVLLDFTSSHHACNRFESAAACRPRKPYILFLAHRHEFLDQHFYVEASKKRKAVMDGVRVVVCTTSRLQKLMSNLIAGGPSLLTRVLSRTSRNSGFMTRMSVQAHW